MAKDNLTIIAEGVKIDGTISFSSSAKINGEINGQIKSDSDITIGRSAKVRADIKTRNAVIEGFFEGKMYASGQVDIKATAKFIGDLIQEKSLLSIEKGGVFKGKSIEGEEDRNNPKDTQGDSEEP